MFCDVCDSLSQGLGELMQTAVLSTSLVAAPAQDAGEASVDAYVISHVNVVDVEKGESLPDRWVRVEDGVIKAISEKGSLELIADATVVDGQGKWLIPGLFDAHVHYTPSPDTFGPLLVAHGVTCVRDLGAMTEAIIAIRERARTTDVFAPDVVCTGAIIDGDPPVWPFSEPCDTPEEGRAAVRKLHAAGVDMIKVYSLLKPEVHLAVIDEAHKLGLKATGHVPDAITYEQLLASGQDCVEHMQGLDKLILSMTEEGLSPEDLSDIWHSYRGYRMYDDVDHAKLLEQIGRMKTANMAMCPTVIVMASIGKASSPDVKNDPRLDFVPMSLRNFWQSSQFAEASPFNASLVANLVKLVGDLHKAGVTLMVGTDLANAYVFPGWSVHEEMGFFAQAGIPPADILRDATIVPARFCGVDDRLGSIAVGKTASLVLLNANPLENIGAASAIEAVFLRGKYYDRAALDAEFDRVRNIAKGTTPTQQLVTLELPGDVMFRGRYAQRFQTMDAGVEDFLITHDEGGYHIMAHAQPQGSPQGPSVVTLHADDNGTMTSAEYKVLEQNGLHAVYTRSGGEMNATMKQNNEEHTQHLDIAAGAIMSTPVSAADILAMKSFQNMEVGETRDVEMVTFGFPSWELAKVPSKVKRLEDEKVTLPDGTEVTARVYESSFDTQYGQMTVHGWIHPSGLTIRSVLKMAFGEVESKLVELKKE